MDPEPIDPKKPIRGYFNTEVPASAPAPPPSAPDWQKNCWWCTVDLGSSGSIFRDLMAYGEDGFHAAISCQKDANNSTAVGEIEATGEPVVNAYIKTIFP